MSAPSALSPVDTRHEGAAGDIESPPRTIEVKAYGRSARGSDLRLEVRQVDEAERNPEFSVYVVENVAQGDPADFTLRVLSGEHLHRLLARKRRLRHFEVPWRVADYDRTPMDSHETRVCDPRELSPSGTAAGARRGSSWNGAWNETGSTRAGG